MSNNSESLAGFNRSDVNIQQRQKVYDGFFSVEKITLSHRLFEGGWGQTLSRELFIRDHAVAAIMYDTKHDLLGLVEQFRIGALDSDRGPWLLEVVAGMMKPGEEPRQVIERELSEEANMTPKQLLPICDYYTSPGGSNEYLSLFCALGDLSQVEGIHGLPEEGEDIRVWVKPAESVLAEIYSGPYNNAATIMCLQWLAMNRSRLRDKYNDE